jgi:hypothetical protein
MIYIHILVVFKDLPSFLNEIDSGGNLDVFFQNLTKRNERVDVHVCPILKVILSAFASLVRG